MSNDKTITTTEAEFIALAANLNPAQLQQLVSVTAALLPDAAPLARTEALAIVERLAREGEDLTDLRARLLAGTPRDWAKLHEAMVDGLHADGYAVPPFAEEMIEETAREIAAQLDDPERRRRWRVMTSCWMLHDHGDDPNAAAVVALLDLRPVEAAAVAEAWATLRRIEDEATRRAEAER